MWAKVLERECPDPNIDHDPNCPREGNDQARMMIPLSRAPIRKTLTELGIARAAGDADVKTHRIEILVNRPDLTVHSPREVIARAPRTNPGADSLLDLLHQPTDVIDLPIAAATYCMRGDQPATLRMIL